MSALGEGQPSIHLIWAQARDAQGRAVIGKDYSIPWYLPEDLAHFKATTLGHPVLMGRKTWASLPPRFRPLPGRRNLVLTRQSTWAADGAEAVASVEQALRACRDVATLWVIGGAEVYAQCLSQAGQVVVTEIDQALDGDAFAPELDATWQAQPQPWQTAAGGLRYRFVTYRRAL